MNIGTINAENAFVRIILPDGVSVEGTQPSEQLYNSLHLNILCIGEKENGNLIQLSY